MYTLFVLSLHIQITWVFAIKPTYKAQINCGPQLNPQIHSRHEWLKFTNLNGDEWIQDARVILVIVSQIYMYDHTYESMTDRAPNSHQCYPRK